MERGDPASARLAFTQVLGRIYDRILEQGCEPVLMALVQRPDSPDKLQRFQALEILNRRVEQFAEKHGVAEVAESARVWATLARLCAKTVWTHLSAGSGADMPAPNETAVLAYFMDDAEVMGLLRLQPGWTPVRIPDESDHPFRRNPISDSGESDHPIVRRLER